MWLWLAGCARNSQVEPFASFEAEDDAHGLIGAAGDAMGVGGLGQARPADAHPADAHPADAHPADAHPADAHPADAHPADAHPADPQPGAPPVPMVPPATVTWQLQHFEPLDARATPLPLAEVERAVTSRAALLRSCYQRELAKVPTLAGRLQVRITVTADGKVSRLEQLASNLGSPGVEACVRDRLTSLVFRQPAGGGVIVGLVGFAPGEAPKPASPLP